MTRQTLEAEVKRMRDGGAYEKDVIAMCASHGFHVLPNGWVVRRYRNGTVGIERNGRLVAGMSGEDALALCQSAHLESLLAALCVAAEGKS